MGNDSLKDIFQQEFSKMVAVISSHFGLHHIELAEDIVSETFLTASETWGLRGVPPNPTAWLYAVAKQKTLYYFRRNKILNEKVLPAVKAGHPMTDLPEEPDFSNQNIRDSQLRMLFAVCTPSIASEAQIGLALRVLCGFGIDEIAEAFLSNKETINKRLFRAKDKLRSEKVKLELPDDNEIPGRLDNVLHIIYLLFNEGYYSKTENHGLRQEFCFEALRLGMLLTEYATTNVPKTNALIALMCFHASRFNARESKEDLLILYEEQDESLWDAELIAQGNHFLALSMKGREISSYHLEARIAAWHCVKKDSEEKWKDILDLYDRLLLVNFSPVVALNRLYALYKVRGNAAAIAEAEKLELPEDHFYFVLMGELYREISSNTARVYFTKALELARTAAERNEILRKLE